MSNYNPVQTGTTNTYGANGNANVFLAAEYLDATVGVEAAQKVNILPNVKIVDLTGKQSSTAHVRFLDKLNEATAATEGGALSVVAWSPEGVNINTGLYGFSVQESKLFNLISPDALTQIAGQASTALARAYDVAIAALFASLTAGTVGTSGGALVIDDILLGNANLTAAYAEGQRFGTVSPRQFYNLQHDAKAGNYGISMLSIDAKGVGTMTVGGTMIKENNLVGKMTSNTNFAGALYVSEAIQVAIAEAPMVEILPIPGYHSYSVDATTAFGVGLVRPTWGCVVRSGVSA